MAEHCVLAVESASARAVGGHDVELAASRIRIGCSGHGQGAGAMRYRIVGVELSGQTVAWAAGAIAQRIAALNHELGFDAVEGEAIVKALPRQEHEGVYRLGCYVRPQLGDDRSAGCLDGDEVRMARGIQGLILRGRELGTGWRGGRLRFGRYRAGNRHAGGDGTRLVDRRGCRLLCGSSAGQEAQGHRPSGDECCQGNQDRWIPPTIVVHRTIAWPLAAVRPNALRVSLAFPRHAALPLLCKAGVVSR